MSSLPAEARYPQALAVSVTEDALNVTLADGRTIAVPLAWYPRLVHATPTERQHTRLIADGAGIRWPDLDEDISIASLIDGRPSQETRPSFDRWLQSRAVGS